MARLLLFSIVFLSQAVFSQTPVKTKVFRSVQDLKGKAVIVDLKKLQ